MHSKEYHKRLVAAYVHALEYLASETLQLKTLISICIEENVNPQTIPLYNDLHARVATLRFELGL